MCEQRHVSIVGKVVAWYKGCRSRSLASLCFHLQGSSIESYTVVWLTHWSVRACNGNILIFFIFLITSSVFPYFPTCVNLLRVLNDSLFEVGKHPEWQAIRVRKINHVIVRHLEFVWDFMRN